MTTPLKHNTATTNLNHYVEGNLERMRIQEDSFDATAFLSKSVEMSDIDNSVVDFFTERLDFVGENGKFPMYTLFSNERFSEYSQTWRHTDVEGNLLMDFFTIRRDPTAQAGNNQGKLWNIPGNRKFEVFRRSVLEDNGTNALEIYSMETPVAVDLKYNLSIVTSKFDNLNDFDSKLLVLFQSCQQYICPHGFFMPMKLSAISDKSEYGIENRKFFTVTADIEVWAYLVPKESLHVDIIPLRIYTSSGMEKNSSRPVVRYDEFEDSRFEISSKLTGGNSICTFEVDDTLWIDKIITDNVRSFEVFMDGERVESTSEGFYIFPCVTVKVKIVRINPCKNVSFTFEGEIRRR